MRRIRFGLLAFALSVVPVSAQTPVIVGQAFAVTFAHTGTNTTGYRVYLDTTLIADVPLSVLQSGTASVPVAGGVSARGPHVLLVSAYNADRETKSDPLSFSAVLPAPDAPSQPAIVITIALNADGTISATWAHQ